MSDGKYNNMGLQDEGEYERGVATHKSTSSIDDYGDDLYQRRPSVIGGGN